MKQGNNYFVHARDQEQTDKLGALLAKNLQPGDLILLNGSLGAGKSSLARAIIRSLLKFENLEVPSPTFLLVLPYENQDYSILHADLYRFEDQNELDDLGLFDDPDAIILVEWSERAPQLIKQANLTIDISFYPDQVGRQFCFSSTSNSKTFQSLNRLALFNGDAKLP